MNSMFLMSRRAAKSQRRMQECRRKIAGRLGVWRRRFFLCPGFGLIFLLHQTHSAWGQSINPVTPKIPEKPLPDPLPPANPLIQITSTRSSTTGKPTYPNTTDSTANPGRSSRCSREYYRAKI